LINYGSLADLLARLLDYPGRLGRHRPDTGAGVTDPTRAREVRAEVLGRRKGGKIL
jgi:hypothetical protein